MHRVRDLINPIGLVSLFPHHVARVTDLLALGVSTTTISTNTAAGGSWQRLLPGILLLSNAPPTRPQVIRAALRYAGDDAVLTGHSALQLYGIRSALPGGPVHVLVPPKRHIRALRKIIIERTSRLPHPILRNDFPVASAERAIMDATRRMESVDSIRAIIAESIQRGQAHPGRLRAELTKANKRGTAAARRVIDELTTGVRTMAEGWARRLLLDTDLPKPLWHVPLCDPAGNLLDIVDAWWDDHGVAWSLATDEWHYPATGPTTLDRLSTLTAAGITVIHTTPTQLRSTPAAILHTLKQTLTAARSRPRLAIIAG